MPSHSIWTLPVFYCYIGYLHIVTLSCICWPDMNKYTPQDLLPDQQFCYRLMKSLTSKYAVISGRVRKILQSDSFVMSVRPSAWNNSAPTGRIFMKFDIGLFSKIRPENSSFIKVWHEQRVLYMKTYVHIKSYPAESFLLQEVFQTKGVEKIKTYILCSITFSRKSCRLRDTYLLYGAESFLTG